MNRLGLFLRRNPERCAKYLRLGENWFFKTHILGDLKTAFLHAFESWSIKGGLISEGILTLVTLPEKYSVFLPLACWRLSFEFSRARTLQISCQNAWRKQIIFCKLWKIWQTDIKEINSIKVVRQISDAESFCCVPKCDN